MIQQILQGKISQGGTSRMRKTKIISADDYFLQSGIMSTDYNGDVDEPEDYFHRKAKEQPAAKLVAKAELYSRTPTIATGPKKNLADGKRHISSQMEKNRGLTRPRKKLIKNPRKKYKLQYEEFRKRRKEQVRDIKKPMGPYGGETSGINAGISRSVKF